jgi:ankyrin repeat protein
LEIVQHLLDSGANIEAEDEDRRTALHWASGEGHLEIVQHLLKSGANIEAKDKDQKTALDLATLWRHIKVVELLSSASSPATTTYFDELMAADELPP